ncbi:MAG: hypothetical protein P8Y70_02845 [Candidatus Lokiarchaeota archaeon]
MNEKDFKKIKERLESERIEPFEDDFDNAENSLEMETLKSDKDWVKKRKEETKLGYEENNFSEGDYDL